VTKKRQDKNQKFTQPKKSKAGLYSIVGVVTVIIVIASYFAFGSDKPSASVNAAANVGQKVNYSPNDKLEQTIVESKIENGKAIVSTLSTVKDKKFIWTEYKANGDNLELPQTVLDAWEPRI